MIVRAAADTIFALSSAPGRAGVAVIRVSGPEAKATLARLAGTVPEPRYATLRTLRDPSTGEALDRALALFFPAPASATGEDVAEFHVHGGRAVIAGVLAALGALPGCRLAQPGEFACRAFLAGKMDLTEAEGLADLIDADTARQRRAALAALHGAHRAIAEDWRARLVEAMALIEAMIDFSDEGDVPADTRAAGAALLHGARDEVARHLASARRGERLREGVRIVLAGPPNAGKSTLLNAFARREVAIVSAEAGTTRDVIEVALDLDGFPVLLADTAGLREADAPVEREGVRRARARIDEADLVLWLIAPDVPDAPAPPARELWRIATKIDRGTPKMPVDHAVSAETGAGLDAILAAMTDFAANLVGDGDAPLVAHVRHRQALEAFARALDMTLQDWATKPVEFLAEDMRAAAQALGRVTGAVDVESVLDAVFGRFCIGK